MDWLQTTRPITAFIYALLVTGKLKALDAEDALRMIENLNADSQQKLYYDANKVMYARSLAERLVVPLCDHPGAHPDGEWTEPTVH
jgi:hypothetical protein